jgi:hypothetical protein
MQEPDRYARMQLVVLSVINRYVLCARVADSNALLRFRFERPLNIEYARPGREITVLECEFSRLTHTINCRRVAQDELLLVAPPARPSL